MAAVIMQSTRRNPRDMDGYPRTRIWPSLTVVLTMFVLAVQYPSWWISWEAGTAALSRLAQRVGWSVLVADSPDKPLLVDVQQPDSGTAPQPRAIPLSPPVAMRVAVDASQEYAETADTVATADFPTDVVSPDEQAADDAPSPSPSAAIGPLYPPTYQATESENPVDLVPSDIDGLSSVLPARDKKPPFQGLENPELTPPVGGGVWPRASSLWTLIGSLAPGAAQVAHWTVDVQDVLSDLESIPSLSDPRVMACLDQLDELAERADSLEVYLDESQRITIRRIRYGIERRAVVWRHLHELASHQQQTPLLMNPHDLSPVLDELKQRLNSHPYADSWRRYLTIDRLTELANEPWQSNSTVRCEAARVTLQRLSQESLTPEQRQFLQDPAIQDLSRHLADWAEQPLDLENLVTSLEQFEETRTEDSAQAVVEHLVDLQFCRLSSAAELRRAIDVHYRNANVRFSISESLMNDLLPVLKPVQQQIRDRILGADVVGQNKTWTDLNLQLIENEQSLVLRIEADGRTQSRTVSSKGPVRLYSQDRGQFRAGKDLFVSSQGIYASKAVASANGRSRLLDVKTDYDQIPFLGWIVRQIALDEHEEAKPQVRAQVRSKITRQAKQQLDASIQERLTGAEQRLDEKLLHPLRELDLDPTAIEMRTTPDRLVMRFRLAANGQLAAYTPRPRSLPNNVLSFQLHESAANNLLQQLHLEDRQIELAELVDRMAEQLKVERQDIHEEIPQDVTVRLAKQLPIRFDFDDDRVLVTIRIQELSTPKRTWRNFVVRGRYRADLGQTHIDLERDGGIELISQRIGFRDQIALRGIFTKVMTNNHRLNILRGSVKSSAQLNNLGVTQFVARDGWIGISVGPQPERTVAQDATRAADARR